ncbi:hypothetical protein SNS2_0111 [Streptomyces netropsis]|uniref:Uncharacterized protein n=1 Tax=Streptomyces syringium TaxID=76729 RepID=A0ABS4XYI4_9ACTN|nr:hypothetical protein [Streptomyces syringium]SPE47706.1 hypothetical protein SNS2_0111 [Streptomyces netropsis]
MPEGDVHFRFNRPCVVRLFDGGRARGHTL